MAFKIALFYNVSSSSVGRGAGGITSDVMLVPVYVVSRLRDARSALS